MQKSVLPLLALLLATATACGAPLQLGTASSNTQTSGDANVRAADANVAQQNPNAVLKCHTVGVSGAELSNCTCSADTPSSCPSYVANSDATLGAWSCTTLAVSGGSVYNCQCNTPQSSSASAAACGAFYNPADPTATANSTLPQTTCQTVPTSFGFQTNCTCTDTNAAPCDFFQGNSYTSTSAPYTEVCSSTLTPSGATTVCTCNQLLQSAGVSCPATFSPSSQTVTDLIY